MTVVINGTTGITNPNSMTIGNGGGSVATNTAVGTSALAANTTGANGVAVGYQAGYSNTTAAGNTAVGYKSLYSTTTAQLLTGVGAYAAYSNTTGEGLVAIGYESLYSNTTGNSNIAIGGYSLYGSVAAALNANTTGSYNIAIGSGVLKSNTTGTFNTAVGYQAGYSNSTNTGNTFIGYTAGYSTTGSYNSFFGPGAGYSVTSGTKNTILGGYNGNQGGLDIRTASNYIVLSDGDGTPRFFTNGPQAWAVNSASGYQYSELDFNIGNSSKAAFYWDNSLLRFYVGTSSAAMYIANGGTSWTSASDERAKDIIETISDAANKVSQLRAVIGKYKTDADGTRRSFLIAQDVLAVLPEAVAVPDEGATEKDGSLAMMGVEYTAVIPLLVAAIKELKTEIDTLKGQA